MHQETNLQYSHCKCYYGFNPLIKRHLQAPQDWDRQKNDYQNLDHGDCTVDEVAKTLMDAMPPRDGFVPIESRRRTLKDDNYLIDQAKHRHQNSHTQAC